MREILFRGKTPKHEPFNEGNNDKWVEGHFCKDSFVEKTYINENVGADNFFMYMVIPETVGEYTGLKDRNGKKIFEGDIVLRCYTGSTGKENRVKQLVVFEKGCFLTKRIDDDYFHGVDPNGYNFYEDYQTLETSTKECSSVNGSFEVIGNIHDNPELVKRRKA